MKQHTILIDATDAYDPNRRGIGVQMQAWLEAADFSDFPEVDWLIARQHRPQNATVTLHGKNVRLIEAPKMAATLESYIDYLHSLNPDVIFTPFADKAHYRKSSAKQISIDYGMEDFYWREYVPPRPVDTILASHAFALQKYDGIVTVSKTSQKDLSWFFPEYKEKLQVVYPNAQEVTGATEPLPTTLEGTRYLVLVGYELKKNILRVASAFDHFKQQTDSDCKLVIIGKPGYGAEQLDTHILGLAHNNDIVRLGYVSDAQKQAVLKHCHAVLALSLYEGFGISALEGLIADKPVLVSNNGSLKEVVGKAGYLADPFSIHSMATQFGRVDKLLDNPKKRYYAERIAAFSASCEANKLLRYLAKIAD